jgi:hypothetical protein
MRLAPQRECLAVADRGEPGELPQEIPPLAVSSSRAWTPSSVTGGRSGRLQKFPSQLFKEQGSRVWPRSRVRRWKDLTASAAPCQPVFHPGDRAGLQQLPDSNRIAAGCQLLFWKVRRSGILPRYSSPRYLTTGFLGCQPLLFRAAPPGGRLPPGLLLPGPRDLITVPRSSSTPFLAGVSGSREGSRLPVGDLPHQPPVLLPRRTDRQASPEELPTARVRQRESTHPLSLPVYQHAFGFQGVPGEEPYLSAVFPCPTIRILPEPGRRVNPVFSCLETA